MYDLPTSITLDSQEWRIRNKGDFRVILDCFLALEDSSLTTEERVIASLIIFYEDINSVNDVFTKFSDAKEAYEAMVKFFNCGQEETKSDSDKLIDWDRDSTLIMSAINKVAGKEVRAEYVHWWTFMGYYVAIGECPLSTIVGLRYKRIHNKKLEKSEREFIRDNPQYFDNGNSVSQKEADEWVRQMWEGGGKIDG